MFDGKKRDNNNGYMVAFAYLLHVGITIISCIAVALFAGYYLDKLLGSSPWMLLLFILFGIIAAFKSIIDFAKKNKF